MSMVHCRGCGQSIHDSAVACPHCGAPQGAATATAAGLAALPAGVAGWSWGAFLLNWLWAAFNNVWIGLLALVPFVGFAMAIVLGFKGREWAWRAKQWESIEHFQRVQRKWSTWGVGLIVLPATIAILAAIALPAYQDYVKRARQAAAQIDAAAATQVAAAVEAAERAERRAAAEDAAKRAQEARLAQQAAQQAAQQSAPPAPSATGAVLPTSAVSASENDLLPEARNCANAVDCATLMLRGAFPRRADIVQAAASSLGNLPKPDHGDRKAARDLNKRALVKFGDNDHDAAAQILKLAAQADPADPEILSNLGLALVKAGHAKEAEGPLLAALELDPRRSSAWAPLAEAMALQQKGAHGQRALLLAYEFSANKQKTLDFYRARNQATELPEMQRDMYAKALQIVESGY